MPRTKAAMKEFTMEDMAKLKKYKLRPPRLLKRPKRPANQPQKPNPHPLRLLRQSPPPLVLPVQVVMDRIQTRNRKLSAKRTRNPNLRQLQLVIKNHRHRNPNLVKILLKILP